MIMAARSENTLFSVVSDNIIGGIVAGMPDGRRGELLAKVEELFNSNTDHLHNVKVLEARSPCLCRGFFRVMLDGWLTFASRPIEALAFPDDLFEACIALSEGFREMGGSADYNDDGVNLLGGIVFDAVRAALECRAESMHAGLFMSLAAIEELENVMGGEIAMVVTHAAQDFTKVWLDGRTEIGLSAMAALSTARGYVGTREVDKLRPEKVE